MRHIKNIFRKKSLLIFIIGILIFSNALLNQFALDDYDQILDNHFVHSFSNIPRLFFQSTWADASVGIYYKPLMTSTFTLLYVLFKTNPFPFHLLQILIHITNAFLFFYLCKFCFKKQPIPFVLALTFLLHPINIDTAIYIASLQDALFLFFGLLALIVISQKKLTIQRYLLLAILLILSLLSKESGVLFILIAPIYRFFLLSRFILFEPARLAARQVENYSHKNFSTLRQLADHSKNKDEVLKVAIVALFIFIAYFILRLKALGPTFYSDSFPIARLSPAMRFAHIPIIIFYYLKTFFFPKDIATGQVWTIQSLDFSHFYMPLIADSLFLVAILVIGELVYKKSKDSYSSFLFFLIWFAIGLLPLMHIIPLDETVAGRWFYFPLIGLLGLLGISIECLTSPKQKHFIAKVVLIVLILFAARTFIRTFDWRTSLSIARHDSQVTESFVLEGMLGYELMQIGSYDEAIFHAKKSIQLSPQPLAARNLLGIIYLRMAYKTHDISYLEKAKVSFDKAITYSYSYLEPYHNQAELLFYFKGPKETIDFINRASKKVSLDSVLWRYLALSEYQLNNKNKALEAARKSYLLDPSNPDSRSIYESLKKNQKITIKTPSY